MSQAAFPWASQYLSLCGRHMEWSSFVWCFTHKGNSPARWETIHPSWIQCQFRGNEKHVKVRMCCECVVVVEPRCNDEKSRRQKLLLVPLAGPLAAGHFQTESAAASGPLLPGRRLHLLHFEGSHTSTFSLYLMFFFALWGGPSRVCRRCPAEHLHAVPAQPGEGATIRQPAPRLGRDLQGRAALPAGPHGRRGRVLRKSTPPPSNSILSTRWPSWWSGHPDDQA